MTFPSIRIEGAILSGDLLAKVERDDFPGQKPADFGLPGGTKVKDEIARAWAEAQSLWAIYRRRLDNLTGVDLGTSETRNLWIVPFLGLLGYHLERPERAEVVLDKTYALSHRLPGRDGFPVHIVGPRHGDPSVPPDRSTLDVKAVAGPRMSPHALLQEYLNLTEHLYGLVTNGLSLRLLRDSSRLIKLSYVEFDLERIFTEQLFADFAVLFRLLHVSRLPARQDATADCWLERYHQDSLDSGARIRERLSQAVESSLRTFANGFLQPQLTHPGNQALREAIAAGRVTPEDFHLWHLRLIYRLLFLLVIEERDLVFPRGSDRRQRDIYYRHYSLQRLRRLAERRQTGEHHHHDLWSALRSLFRLFESDGPGAKLGIAPLGGDLFDASALGLLAGASLDNQTVLDCLRNLSVFEHPETQQRIRVNYAALNVEEFGSVYEGLLEYDPHLTQAGARWTYELVKGEGRSKSGSHYTPDELVEPLIRHSLDHLIADKLAAARAAASARPQSPPSPPTARGEGGGELAYAQLSEQALLSLKICDVACGSGHILLAAARRLGREIALLRTDEEQPSPEAMRHAVRDVIRHCIYGMDLNPLAVELCKVALWLEAHVPGWPLSFLDHRIHCGNAIVGLAHRAELQRGIPDEAFKTLPGDDKDLAAALRKQNKEERKGQTSLNFAGRVADDLRELDEAYQRFERMPERSAADYYVRRTEYEKFRDNLRLRNLRLLADTQVAQFFLPKTPENRGKHVTHDTFSRWMKGLNPSGPGIAAAMTLSHRKHFGHWFVDFWDVMDDGGFDLIIGNPPYLGGQALSGSYGHVFCEWVKWEYVPAGLSDLVVYFLRRAYDLLRPGGFIAFITTNSIKDGDVRADGLEQVMKQGGNLTFAVSGTIWPGVANLYVSLFSLHKGPWENRPRVLDGRRVPFISAFFEDYADAGKPNPLPEAEGRVFQGSILLGDGFLLSHEDASAMRSADPRLAEVIFPVINGQELNNEPEQTPRRSVINFFDWSLEKASGYGPAIERVRELVKPVRDQDNRAVRRERWWQHAERAMGLYNGSRGLCRCFVAAATTKHLSFSAAPTDRIFLNTIYVFTTERWSDFAVVQSTLHEVWARKYSGALKKDLRYSPTDCFLTFPFPRDPASDSLLAAIGETYHEHRRALMRNLWLGLTDLYNLFHNSALTPKLVTKSLGDRATITGDEGFTRIQRLRDLHRELDQTVLTAYGWHTASDFGPAIALRHDFHPLDFLPENDRIRLTLHPESRREVLARLLKLNHQRAAEAEQIQKQAPATASAKVKPKPKQTTVTAPPELNLGLDLFGRPAAATPVERSLPTGTRTTLGGQLYAIQLVRALLVESGGSMTWPRLVDAFTLATHPALMQENTKSADAARVIAWSRRWSETLPPGSLVTAIETLGAGNLKVERQAGIPRISLRQAPSQSAAADIAYDAWLALHVLGPAPTAQQVTPSLVIPEFDHWTTRMESLLVA